MAGLLGSGWDDPKSSAIMALSAGLLNGNFGAGLLGANNAFAQSKNDAAKKQYLDMQMQEMQAKAEEARRKREFLQNLPDPQFAAGQQGLLGGGGPTMANAANTPQVSPQQQMLYQAAKAGVVDLPDYLKATMPKEEEWSPTPQFMKNAQGQLVPVLVSKSGKTKELPYGAKPEIVIEDMGGTKRAINKNELTGSESFEKTGNPFSDLLLKGPNGSMVPNSPLVGVKGQIAAQGAPRIQMPAINLSDPTAVARAGMALQNDVRTAFKDDYVIANQFQAIKAAAQDPSPQGDTALLYSFFKVLDPASTVREGEIAMVKDNRSIPDRFKAYAQKLAGGGSLLPEERQDIMSQANRQVQARIPRAKQDLQAYRENASRLQLDPKLYVPDPYGDVKPDAPTPKSNAYAALPTANASNKGKVATDTVTGKKFVSNGMQWVEKQ